MVGRTQVSRHQEGRRRVGSPPLPGVALPVVWVVFAGLVLESYWGVFGLGFSNDDYLILERVMATPLRSLVGWSGLMIGWWRPWSREIHFWLLYRFYGADSPAFHVANVVLWLSMLALMMLHVRRLTDVRTAVLVLAGALSASAWGVYLAWASCSQDLWMLLAGTAFLTAQYAGRRWLAPLALALALLSKETAVLLVPLAAWTQFALRGRSGLRTRDWIGPGLVTLAWLALHPSFGGRWLFASGVRLAATPADELHNGALTGMLAPLNLEHWPAPAGGALSLLPDCALWAATVGAVVWWALRRREACSVDKAQRAVWIRLGLGWWAIGWAPMAWPMLKWHSYYGWLGLCGAWLAGVAYLLPRPRVLGVLLVAVAALRPLAAGTLCDDWSTERHQASAAVLTDRLRDQMLSIHPTLPPHSRIFLANLPGGLGFRSGPRYSAAVHVWYHDMTITGTTFPDYWRRTAGEATGPDYFYIADMNLRLLPVASAPIPVPDSLRANFLWQVAEEHVAGQFAAAGEWGRARANYVRLYSAYPETARYAYGLAVATARLGDSASARSWFNRAEVLVGASPKSRRGDLRAQRP